MSTFHIRQLEEAETRVWSLALASTGVQDAVEAVCAAARPRRPPPHEGSGGLTGLRKQRSNDSHDLSARPLGAGCRPQNLVREVLVLETNVTLPQSKSRGQDAHSA